MTSLAARAASARAGLSTSGRPAVRGLAPPTSRPGQGRPQVSVCRVARPFSAAREAAREHLCPHCPGRQDWEVALRKLHKLSQPRLHPQLSPAPVQPGQRRMRMRTRLGLSQQALVQPAQLSEQRRCGQTRRRRHRSPPTGMIGMLRAWLRHWTRPAPSWKGMSLTVRVSLVPCQSRSGRPYAGRCRAAAPSPRSTAGAPRLVAGSWQIWQPSAVHC